MVMTGYCTNDTGWVFFVDNKSIVSVVRYNYNATADAKGQRTEYSQDMFGEG